MTTQISDSLTLKIAASEMEREQVIELLKQQDLPTTDIDEDKQLYLLLDSERLIGTAGLEIFEDCALLRSVSVVKEEQGKGHGKFINRQIEHFAKESGIKCMYLLTNTARDFFTRLGYCNIKREEAPAAIKQTAEFASLCPSTAVLMIKHYNY